MKREPVKQKGLVTVSCIDGRWFQAKIGNPALPTSRIPLPVPEWEVRNALALLHIAMTSLASASWVARLLRLPKYRNAQAVQHDAMNRFADTSTRSKAHQAVAERLQRDFQTKAKGK